MPEEVTALPGHALKRSFGSCAVYSITVDDRVSSFAYENNTESKIASPAGALLGALETLKNLTTAMENNVECPLTAYLSAVELLWQIENHLLHLYDVLENPEVPILANSLKEALMNCYICIANQLDAETYFERLHRESQAFYEKMDIEFS